MKSKIRADLSPLSPFPVVAATARWGQNGVTVAGGRGQGNSKNQLHHPEGIFVNDEGTVIIADYGNHRIMEWKGGATSGTPRASGEGQRNRPGQLNYPTNVIFDKETDSLIICEYGNRRLTQWPLRNGTRKAGTIIDNINCYRLALDDEGSLYVTDREKHEVRRYRRGETSGIVVAGENGKAAGLHQLNLPTYICVDGEHGVYVSDNSNHRVMKWVKDAQEGIVVAGGRGQGDDMTQLSFPHGVWVDAAGTVYAADEGNARVMRWCREAAKGTVVVGGNREGAGANQLNQPFSLSFDLKGNLYVADYNNHRVQRFFIEKN
jgi:sugar lactone lactonase YvrE